MKKLIFAGLLSMLLPKQAVAQTFKEVDYTPNQTKFVLFAPNQAKQVTVRIYKDGFGGKAIKTVKMQRTAKSSGRPPSRATSWASSIPSI